MPPAVPSSLPTCRSPFTHSPTCRLYVITVLLFGGIGGWLASWLNLFFAASLTILNTQLIYVIRYATRNASVCFAVVGGGNVCVVCTEPAWWTGAQTHMRMQHTLQSTPWQPVLGEQAQPQGFLV